VAPPIDWQNLWTNLVDSTGVWTYEDLTATNSPERYYRAKALDQ
jgi:hypothetical protein